MLKDSIHLYGAIEKFDSAADGSLMVSGIASTESVDNSGEIVTADAMRKALPSYLQTGSVREMHQPIAAGCPISAHVDDDGKTHFTAKIVDVGTIAKIKAGVLKGFSIGGKAIRKVGNRIEEILLKEISCVDLMCNPESVFTLIKFDKPGESCNDPQCKTNTELPCPSCGKIHKSIMSQEAMQKLDSLAETVKVLAQTVETLSKATPQVPAELTKALADIGDLKKSVTESQKASADAERNGIIQKMESEGRVAFNGETGLAYKTDELQKLDINILKFAAKNSPVVPLQAKAIYKGESKPNLDASLKGTALVTKAWESDYGDLEKMLETPFGSTRLN